MVIGKSNICCVSDNASAVSLIVGLVFAFVLLIIIVVVVVVLINRRSRSSRFHTSLLIHTAIHDWQRCPWVGSTLTGWVALDWLGSRFLKFYAGCVWLWVRNSKAQKLSISRSLNSSTLMVMV